MFTSLPSYIIPPPVVAPLHILHPHAPTLLKSSCQFEINGSANVVYCYLLPTRTLKCLYHQHQVARCKMPTCQYRLHTQSSSSTCHPNVQQSICISVVGNPGVDIHNYPRIAPCPISPIRDPEIFQVYPETFAAQHIIIHTYTIYTFIAIFAVDLIR